MQHLKFLSERCIIKGKMTDEEDDKPYESYDDWKKEIKYLMWPLALIAVIILVILILMNIYFPS